MSNWDKLSMREKAAYIKVGVLNGLTSISDIKEYYDRFLDIDSEKFNHHNNNYNEIVNKFGDGGYTTPEELALKKIKATTKPASNYSEASDLNVSKIRENVTNYILKYFPNRSLGLTNCTLTASLFYGKPIGRASSIVNNPAKYGFYEVDEKYAVPGTMIIASDPEGVKNPKYHSMVLSGFADKDHLFEYNNIPYNVVKGDILTSYSKGRNNESSWKIDIPLKTYNDLSAGKTRNRFYRPLDENGLPNVLLPEVVVTANKENNLNNAKRYVQKAVKKYDIGGPTDDKIITTGNEIGDVALSFAPFVGTAMDIEEAMKNPTFGNISIAAGGLVLDAFGLSLIKGAFKTARAATKAAKAVDKLSTSKKTYEKALKNAEKYGNTPKRRTRVRDTWDDYKTAEKEFKSTHKSTNRRGVDRKRKHRYEAPTDWSPIINPATVYGTEGILNASQYYTK